MENNKFSMAAKIWKEMAGMQEKEHDTRAAINSYQKAAGEMHAQQHDALRWLESDRQRADDARALFLLSAFSCALFLLSAS